MLRCVSLVAALCACSSSPPTADPRVVNCQGACTVQASYTISTDGFFAGDRDRAFLEPPQVFRHRAPGTPVVACAPQIPPCMLGGPVSMCDIGQDLLDDDVTGALAQARPPFFNEDLRGIDGEAFSFMRADGHGFEMSNRPCESKGCRPVPPGIQRLVNDLMLLDKAVIQTPECQALNVPLSVAGATRF
ncbi:MAG TPA: hypothetical protein VN914_15465 [Polyangia bacterium]|nr:hypothetical protein [Polyangia bacterium]